MNLLGYRKTLVKPGFRIRIFFLRIRIRIRAKIFMRIRILGVSGEGAGVGVKGKNDFFFFGVFFTFQMIFNNGCLKSEQKKWNCLHCTSPTLQNNDLFIHFLNFLPGSGSANLCESGSGSGQGKNMRIRADPDPDPKPCFKVPIIYDHVGIMKLNIKKCSYRSFESLTSLSFKKLWQTDDRPINQPTDEHEGS